MRFTRASVLHLVVGEERVRAEAVRSGTVVWAGEATYESSADLAEVVARLAAEPAERCRELNVTLERPPAQTRTLGDLPPVRDRELAALVANQAGRFFRRNGAPLVTDATWVQNGKGRVTHAAAVAEPVVLAIVAGAKEAGLNVTGISAAGVSPQVQLLPTAERAARERAQRRLVARLGALVLASWVLAAAMWLARLVVERRAIDAELAQADAPRTALHEVRQEMRIAEAMVEDLSRARASRGEALAALTRVSAALPDSSILTSYSWRANGSGVVAGAGRRAADVLAAVERSHAVVNPRLEGAVVHDAVAGHVWERFTITFGARDP